MTCLCSSCDHSGNVPAQQVVAYVLKTLGSDAEIAEYCVAAIATLSIDVGGSKRLGEAGAVEGVSKTMTAHLGNAKPEVQAYGCASLQRMTNVEGNVRRLVRCRDVYFGRVFRTSGRGGGAQAILPF